MSFASGTKHARRPTDQQRGIRSGYDAAIVIDPCYRWCSGTKERNHPICLDAEHGQEALLRCDEPSLVALDKVIARSRVSGIKNPVPKRIAIFVRVQKLAIFSREGSPKTQETIDRVQWMNWP